jgi:four helix bundle protein
MQNPSNLQVYHRALDVALAAHELAHRIPRTRAPGLASQVGRAAASIPANIAEGIGHPVPGRCPYHLAVAIASAFEVEIHLRLAQRLYPRIGDISRLLDELDQIRRMIYSLREYKLQQLDARPETKRGRSPSPFPLPPDHLPPAP